MTILLPLKKKYLLGKQHKRVKRQPKGNAPSNQRPRLRVPPIRVNGREVF